jgi:hypothetical protein
VLHAGGWWRRHHADETDRLYRAYSGLTMCTPVGQLLLNR